LSWRDEVVVIGFAIAALIGAVLGALFLLWFAALLSGLGPL
jgi:hypothetical protein